MNTFSRVRILAVVIAAVLCAAQTTHAAPVAGCTDESSDDENIAASTKVIEGKNSTILARVQALRNRAYATRYGDTKKAIIDTSEAIRLKPEDAQLYADRAGIYANEEYSEAEVIADLTKAIELSPKNARHKTAAYYTLRAKAYKGGESNDIDKLSDLEKALELDPKNLDALQTLGSYYLEHYEFDKALKNADAMKGLVPHEYMVPYTKGHIRTRMGESGPAIENLTEAVALLSKEKKTRGEQKPGIDDAFVYGTRGLNYLNAGNYNLAIADLSRAIGGADHGVLRQLRGMAFMANKQYDLAIEDFTKGIEIDPKTTLTYVLRAEAYDKAGRNKEAAIDRSSAAFIGAGLMQPRKK